MKIKEFEFDTEAEYATKGTELMKEGYFIRAFRKTDNRLYMKAVKLEEGEDSEPTE